MTTRLALIFGGRSALDRMTSGNVADLYDQIGDSIAKLTSRADLPWTFYVVNDPNINAFAVPGGYVYITRQLMSLMNDESELAFALGHEAAHIAANHAQQREAIMRRNSQGALAARILGSIIGGSFGNAIAQRSQMSAVLQTLSFSRDQEHQSDQLGIRYLIGAGYDTTAATFAWLLWRAALEPVAHGEAQLAAVEHVRRHDLPQRLPQRVLRRRLGHPLVHRQRAGDREHLGVEEGHPQLQ